MLPRLVSSTMERISGTIETVFEWIDDHREASIMGERINKGSDRFFAAEKERRETAGDGPLEGLDIDDT